MNQTCAFCCANILKLRLCDVCRVTLYCSRECRERDWNEHRKLCDYNSKNDKLDHEEKYLRSQTDLNLLIYALDALSKPKSLNVIPKSMFTSVCVTSNVEARGFVACNEIVIPNTVYYIVADGTRRHRRSKYKYSTVIRGNSGIDSGICSSNGNELVELLKDKYPNIVDLAVGKVFVVYDPKPNDTIVDSVYVYKV